MKWTDKRHYDVLETGICRNLHRVRVGHILNLIADTKAKANRPLRILDLGCGDGVITKRIHDRFPEEIIVGIDIDRVRINRARLLCQKAAFLQADTRFLPYSKHIFDILLCHHIIEHVADEVRFLCECRRVLIPGGTLILGIPHEGGMIGRILRRMHSKLYAEGEHLHFYTIAGMRRLLIEQGFSAVEYAKFGFLFPNYYIHLVLLSNSLTFKIGNFISQHIDFTADSLIFIAKNRN